MRKTLVVYRTPMDQSNGFHEFLAVFGKNTRTTLLMVRWKFLEPGPKAQELPLFEPGFRRGVVRLSGSKRLFRCPAEYRNRTNWESAKGSTMATPSAVIGSASFRRNRRCLGFSRLTIHRSRTCATEYRTRIRSHSAARPHGL